MNILVRHTKQSTKILSLSLLNKMLDYPQMIFNSTFNVSLLFSMVLSFVLFCYGFLRKKSSHVASKCKPTLILF